MSLINCMMTSSNGNIFRVTLPFVRGIHWSPVNSTHKGQWRGALMLSKQWWDWWFEMPTRSLWRHCNGGKLQWNYMDTFTECRIMDYNEIAGGTRKWRYTLYQLILAWTHSGLVTHCHWTESVIWLVTWHRIFLYHCIYSADYVSEIYLCLPRDRILTNCTISVKPSNRQTAKPLI